MSRGNGSTGMSRAWAGLLVAVSVALAAGPAAAVNISLVKIGTWTTGPTAANAPAANGPGLATGQRYVLRIDYDPASPVTQNVPILTGFFVPSGNFMATIDLNAGSNSMQLLVPMEGKDSGGTHFIYEQTEATHWPAFIPNPTLQFVNGTTDLTDTSKILGIEFEGDFAPSFAANHNIAEIFTVSPGGAIINQVSQILNCTTALCGAGTNVAITGVNALTDAVTPTVDAGPDRVYSASVLSVDTQASSPQNNDLGNARADGEDFLDFVWTRDGGTLTGTAPVSDPGGNNLTVAIEHSGLVHTTSTVTWDVEMQEQLTGFGAVADALTVTYLNADPEIKFATASPVAGGFDFELAFDDADLVVNGVIPDFELLTTELLVDGVPTNFFDALFNAGTGFLSETVLRNAFGAGLHEALLSVTDRAGATAVAGFQFFVPVPLPGAVAPFALALAVVVRHGRRRRAAEARGDV